MMNKNKSLAIALILTMAVSLTGTALAKNENSGNGNSGNSGNSNKSENSGKSLIILGEVDDVKGNNIKVEDKKGKTQNAEVNTKTEVIHQNKGKGQGAALIKKNDKVAILSDDSGESTPGGKVKKAVKVFVKEATTSAQSKRRAIQGVVTGISGSTITLAHQTQTDRVTNVLTDASTEFKVKGITDGSLASLKVGQRIVAMGDVTDGGLLAKRVHVIPGLAKGVFKKNPVASSSAQPSASASALPTAEPTASASATPEL